LFSPSKEAKAISLEYLILESSTYLAPGTYVEGCILFHIPE